MKFKEKNNTQVISNKKWKLLIVDDDIEVHNITKTVLQNFVFMKKKLEFYDAFSGAESLEILKQIPDINVVLLDVIMETDDAGLVVAKKIREDLNNSIIRIILRTGQPGLYPPKDIIVDYDIDDYKEKTELSASKLFITMVSSLRMSHYINQLNDQNVFLQQTIDDEIEKNRQKDKYLIEQNRRAQLGDMLSMIAHQWRQPLTAISSSASSLTMKCMLGPIENEFVMKISQRISRYSNHLSATIDDFRNFFKPNKEKSYSTMDKIVKNTLNIIEPSIDGRYIDIKVNLNCNIKFYTYVNEFQHVVLNILQNAQDALQLHSIKDAIIKVETFYDDKTMFLVISDNAGGIPKNIIDKIFDPYFSTKSEKNGTGLGLYMSKTIVEEHCNGTLMVSNENSEAKFTIAIPIRNINDK